MVSDFQFKSEMFDWLFPKQYPSNKNNSWIPLDILLVTKKLMFMIK